LLLLIRGEVILLFFPIAAHNEFFFWKRQTDRQTVASPSLSLLKTAEERLRENPETQTCSEV
jgi:hypothetical protein